MRGMDNINKIANLYTDEASNIMNILNYDNKHPINYIVDDKGGIWFKGKDIAVHIFCMKLHDLCNIAYLLPCLCFIYLLTKFKFNNTLK